MKLNLLPTLLLATVMFNIFQPKIYAEQYQRLTASDVQKFIDATATRYDWKELKDTKKLNPRTKKILKIVYIAPLRKKEYLYAHLDHHYQAQLKNNSIYKKTLDCAKKIIHIMEYKKLKENLVPIRSKKSMDNFDYKAYCKS